MASSCRTPNKTVDWLDKDSLLVARDWGAGTMTKSGYPFVVKLWKRGAAAGAGEGGFSRHGERCNVASGYTLNDSQGHRVTLLEHELNFFESEYFLWTPGGNKKLALPAKSGREWIAGQPAHRHLEPGLEAVGRTMFPMGSVISLDMNAVKTGPGEFETDCRSLLRAQWSSLNRCKPPRSICC